MKSEMSWNTFASYEHYFQLPDTNGGTGCITFELEAVKHISDSYIHLYYRHSMDTNAGKAIYRQG